MSDAGIHRGWAVGVDGERIAAVGPQNELRRQFLAGKKFQNAFRRLLAYLVRMLNRIGVNLSITNRFLPFSAALSFAFAKIFS